MLISRHSDIEKATIYENEDIPPTSYEPTWPLLLRLTNSHTWVGRWALGRGGIYVGLKVCILKVRQGHFSYSSSRMVHGFLSGRKAAAAAQGSGAAAYGVYG
jgi:hypothetical protein